MLTISEDRLRLLRGQAHEWARDLRPYALAVDGRPDIVPDLLHLPALSLVSRLQIPPAYNDSPLIISGTVFHVTSAVERSVWCEEMAWGDLGISLASPGASMCGVMVDALGDDQQKRWFYERLQERPTWTFFGLTEPQSGSDPVSLRSTLTSDGSGALCLDGAKRYVSNALRAQIGVVFARTGPGPFGIRAVLVEAPSSGLSAEAIPTICVRAAQLAALTMNRMRVRPERLLGGGHAGLRRGLWGAVRTLNLLRPTVAAMAVGLSRAAYEYVLDHHPRLSRAEQDEVHRIGRAIDRARQLTLTAAAAVDRDPADGALASVAKQRAARLAADVTRAALYLLGPGARLEHPFLDKLARDALGLELMEGSGDVQRLSVAAAMTRRAFDPSGGHE